MYIKSDQNFSGRCRKTMDRNQEVVTEEGFGTYCVIHINNKNVLFFQKSNKEQ